MAVVTNQEYCKFFWVPADEPGHSKCTMCGTVYKNPVSGFTNFMTHLNGSHKDEYQQEYKNVKSQPGGRDISTYFKRKASVKATNIYKWIDWVVEGNLPFYFVNLEITRQNSIMDPISTKTLKKYMRLLMKKIQADISIQLKKIKTFGLITDGWSQDVEHYLAIFATYVQKDERSGRETVVEVLLSCSVQEDIDVTDDWVPDIGEEDKAFGLTADDMFDHIVGVLVADFDIDINVDNFDKFVEFLAGDNVSTNRSFCNRTGIPLAGCGAHRLQLAVNDYLGKEETKRNGSIIQPASPEQAAIRKLDLLMGELKTIKNAAILRAGLSEADGDIKPERRTKVKWASLFKMLKKWEKLKIPIERKRNDFPESVTEKIPNVTETVLLESITKSLADFESVSKALQLGGDRRLSRYDMRGLFDKLCEAYETNDRLMPHLHADGQIVNNKHFENAIVKIQGRREDTLSNQEKNAVKVFKKVSGTTPTSGGATEQTLSFAERSLAESQAAKKARTDKSAYRSVAHVSSTSLICERLFSRAKLIMSHLRAHMDPDSLAMLLFLKVNKNFWNDATIIDDIITTPEDDA